MEINTARSLLTEPKEAEEKPPMGEPWDALEEDQVEVPPPSQCQPQGQGEGPTVVIRKSAWSELVARVRRILH